MDEKKFEEAVRLRGRYFFYFNFFDQTSVCLNKIHLPTNKFKMKHIKGFYRANSELAALSQVKVQISHYYFPPVSLQVLYNKIAPVFLCRSLTVFALIFELFF